MVSYLNSEHNRFNINRTDNFDYTFNAIPIKMNRRRRNCSHSRERRLRNRTISTDNKILIGILIAFILYILASAFFRHHLSNNTEEAAICLIGAVGGFMFMFAF